MAPQILNDAIIYNDSYDPSHEEEANGYRRVGEALQNGAGIKSIVVDLTALFREAVLCNDEVSESQLDEGSIVLFTEKTMERAAPMIQYVRESSILTALALNDGFGEGSEDRVCWEMAGHFLQAVLDNHHQQLKRGSISSIEKLEIREWAYIENSREIFANILCTCTSLRHLTVCVDYIVNWTWFTQALGSNTSLEHVYINNEGDVFLGPRIVASIIWSLSQHPRLKTMAFPCLADYDRENEIARALGDFLRRTRSLRRLEIDWICFTVEGMGILVDGLRSNHGNLKVIHFGECAFLPDPEECEVFMEYFKSPACEPISLRELTYSGDRLDLLAEAMQKEGSVGSALQVLAFFSENVDQDIPGFLQSLASRGCRNRLKSLTLEICRDSVDALAECLRSFAHLRKLKMRFFAGSRGWCKVVKAVKKNGSLHKVSSLGRLHKPGRRTRRYLKAIGRRNRLTPKLLANPRRDDHPDGADDNDDDATGSATTDMKQFPTLFMASLDAERTAPNMLLTGLMSTLDIFGHHGNGKRMYQA